MYEDIYEMIKTDAEFQRIIKRRQRVSLIITSLILTMFLTLLFTIIYVQSLFNAATLHKDIITFFTLFTFTIVLASSILANVCMKKSGRKLELLLNRLKDDC